MILIRRLWLLPAIVVTALLYFFLWYPTDDRPYYPPNSPDGRVHWKQRPERYPVDAYIALPQGPVKPIPRIQADFAAQPETAEAKKIREERRAAVKEAFLHSWHGYKKYAWGKDEVAPLSRTHRSSFGGWGATLVDSMDTLWIMGLEQDFNECIDAVMKIDFTTNIDEMLNVFETTIRYLGGLLAAYDLSGAQNQGLLDKARELGNILYSAFDNPKRMPVCRWQWRKSAVGGSVEPAKTTLLAELGSMTVEFTRLSQLTGDNKYFDAVQRISEEMRKAQDSTLIPGLWPTIVDAKEIRFDYNHFTFGGMADSTYEYLPKQYMMLGGQDDGYRTMYEKAIDAAKKYLFFRPLVPTGEDLLYSGNTALSAARQPILEPQGQHLTCFVGGMVAVAAKIFNRPSELDTARKLVDGCVWAYNAIPSGLMPESFHLAPCHLGTGEAEPTKCDWSDDKWYAAVAERQGVTADTKGLSIAERGKYFAKKKLISAGFTAHGDNRYILRPEAIESVFIMYRITGDTRYQEIAWKMFQSIDKATRTQIAHAAVHDVRATKPRKSDRMESFWLAETLKYFYLIFSEPGLVSLDEWVLNTEAHPLKRPM